MPYRPCGPGALKQKKFRSNKFGRIFSVLIRSIAALHVESEGFEPASKQAIEKLSTRLFFAWVSM